MQSCKLYKSASMHSCKFHESQKSHEFMLDIGMHACYRKGVLRDKPDRREGKDLRELIGWLKAAGFTAEQITECIEYITK